MKSIYSMICAFALLVMANACTPKNAFTIEGNIAGIPDGTIMTLTPGATHKQEKSVAEATVTDGKFSFNYAVESPRLFYIGQQGIAGLLPVFVENETHIKVTAKAEYCGEPAPNWLDFKDIQVTGSSVHDEFLAKQAFQKELDQLSARNRERHQTISSQLSNAYQAKDKHRIDSLKQTDAYATMSRDDSIVHELRDEKVKNLILKNKDTWWGPFFTLYKFVFFDNEQKEWFAAFSDEAKQSYYGKIVEAELYPPASEGKPAPAFTVKDADGNALTLAQLIAGKKYVLIDFWASWCGPCRREIPNLKAAYETFAPRGLEIISISTDRDPAAWQKALDEEQLPWLNFRDDSGIADAYSVRGIPAIFLVDADGTIIATKLRGEALQQKLAELLP